MMFANGHIASGEKVLILGASGGVGTCCLFLAKMAGCEVIVVSQSQDKLDKLKELGADQGIFYDGFEKKIWEMYGKPHRRTFDGGVDVVVNFTGGDSWRSEEHTSELQSLLRITYAAFCLKKK